MYILTESIWLFGQQTKGQQGQKQGTHLGKRL